MTCCGNRKRSRFTAATPGHSSNRRVLFEYDGPNSLTVFGRVTGIRYHFPGPGARVRVDARDAPVLEVLRGLKVVA